MKSSVEILHEDLDDPPKPVVQEIFVGEGGEPGLCHKCGKPCTFSNGAWGGHPKKTLWRCYNCKSAYEIWTYRPQFKVGDLVTVDGNDGVIVSADNVFTEGVFANGKNGKGWGGPPSRFHLKDCEENGVTPYSREMYGYMLRKLLTQIVVIDREWDK